MRRAYLMVYRDLLEGEPSTTCSWINFPINQSYLRDKFTVYVKFRHRTRVYLST